MGKFKRDKPTRRGSRESRDDSNDFDSSKVRGPRKFDRRDSRRDSGRSSGRDSGRGSRRDSGRSSRIEMHQVVCDKCGNDCEVPFKPTSSKPIYCSDCFKKEDGRSRDSPSSSRNKSSKDKPLINLDEINTKLDKIMEALKIK